MNERSLVVSTRNVHKLAELRALLNGLPWAVRTAAECGVPDVPETGATFADNAILKARAAFELTGSTCLADDSGLVVDALDGAPGVYSARFAGEGVTYADNNAQLLRALGGVAAEDRTAAFVCTLALLVPEALAVDAGPEVQWRRARRPNVPPGAAAFLIDGSVAGRIIDRPRGEGGFGYDPLFLYEPAGLTFAELPSEEKNRISHRGRAFAGLRACLEAMTA